MRPSHENPQRAGIMVPTPSFEAAIEGGSPLLAPVLHTISCSNPATCVLLAGDGASARDLLRQATNKLVAVASHVANPIALRINCVRHLR